MLTRETYHILSRLSTVPARTYRGYQPPNGSEFYSTETTEHMEKVEQDGLIIVARKDTKDTKTWAVTLTRKGREVLKRHYVEVASARLQTHVERMAGFGNCVLCGQLPEETSSFGGLRCSNPNCSLCTATILIPAWKELGKAFKEPQG